jgi:hypothetical protein
MAEGTNGGGNAAAGKIEFIQSHRPTLTLGEYEISVTQEVQTVPDTSAPPDLRNPSRPIPLTTYTASKSFTVRGERFALKPEDINAVFPPDGSLGDHSNVLPHVVLNRSTLPWERSASRTSGGTPWLALLLFDQGEAPEPKVLTLADLSAAADPIVKFPPTSTESGQAGTDKVTVIDVPMSLLEQLMPTGRDLEFLAHVRQLKDATGKPAGGELAVVIGNRLPRKGAISTVHLVSVEGRYETNAFDFQRARAQDSIRLVSLKSWSFACADARQSFRGLLAHADRNPGTLRLPASASPEAEKYLALGYVPLPHNMRQGEKTASWYHGPLAPAYNDVEIVLPAHAADELVRYEPANGLFDVSYAAAWELGRLLALQSKSFSVSLYNWKRAHAQHLAAAEQRLLHPHLPGYEQANDKEPLPAEVAKWLSDLSLLRGVPFNYLVPDERMLPPESIRFFLLDNPWVECLLDGAFSIGRVTTAAHAQDESHEDSPAANPHDKVSGFLLRSDVVAGWSGMVVDGYDAGGKRLESLRADRLSDKVMLCLFAGELKSLEIHQQPEALHFGLDVNPGDTPAFYKKLRDAQGVEGGASVNDIPWRRQTARVIKISDLAVAIEGRLDSDTRSRLNVPPMTSAQFALQMIEGAEKIIFKRA